MNSTSNDEHLCHTFCKIPPSVWDVGGPLNTHQKNLTTVVEFNNNNNKTHLVLLIDVGGCFYLLHAIFFPAVIY